MKIFSVGASREEAEHLAKVQAAAPQAPLPPRSTEELSILKDKTIKDTVKFVAVIGGLVGVSMLINKASKERLKRHPIGVRYRHDKEWEWFEREVMDDRNYIDTDRERENLRKGK